MVFLQFHYIHYIIYVITVGNKKRKCPLRKKRLNTTLLKIVRLVKSYVKLLRLMKRRKTFDVVYENLMTQWRERRKPQ